MQHEYLSQLRKHLLVSPTVQDQIIAELEDHMSLQHRDDTLDYVSDTQEDDLLGDPRLLAEQFNATHIPLYHVLFNAHVFTLCMLIWLAIVRLAAMQSWWALDLFVPGALWFGEINGLLLAIFLTMYFAMCKRPASCMQTNRTILIVVLAVQTLAAFLGSIVLQYGFLWSILSIAKGVSYMFMLPMFIELSRDVLQRRWLQCINRLT